jgi:hypothetical protein
MHQINCRKSGITANSITHTCPNPPWAHILPPSKLWLVVPGSLRSLAPVAGDEEEDLQAQQITHANPVESVWTRESLCRQQPRRFLDSILFIWEITKIGHDGPTTLRLPRSPPLPRHPTTRPSKPPPLLLSARHVLGLARAIPRTRAHRALLYWSYNWGWSLHERSMHQTTN